MQTVTTVFRDPHNTAFKHGETWFRIASGPSAKALTSFRESDVYSRWVADGRLVAFDAVDDAERADVIAAFRERSPRTLADDVHVFRVESVLLITYPWEWPDRMLSAAAELTLELRGALLPLGLDLKDGSALNVQFRGMSPVFMDLGSIDTRRPNPSWNATRQFVEHFINPLSLAASAPMGTAEAWRLGRYRGVRSDIARSLLQGSLRWRPSLWLLQASTRPRGNAPPAETAYAAEAVDKQELALKATTALNKRLLGQVRKLAGSEHDTTWSDYGPRGHYARAELSEKIALTRRFIGEAPGRGRLVLDVGGNDGLVARELLGDCADRVVVMDMDEGALDRLAQAVEKDPTVNTVLTPLLGDLTDLTPRLGLLHEEFGGFQDRVEPTAVLCQAVLHHVVITQGVPMQSAVAALAGFGAPLQVEFATEDDPKVLLLLTQIPNWAGAYNTDELLDAMRMFYEDVRVVAQTTETRVVVEATSPRG
jgi:hypothetical protein